MAEHKRILIWQTPARWHYRIVGADGKTIDHQFTRRYNCNLDIDRQMKFHRDAEIEIVVLKEPPT